MQGHAYWRQIVMILCLKAVGLSVLYFIVLEPSRRPAVGDLAVANHLLIPSTPRGMTP